MNIISPEQNRSQSAELLSTGLTLARLTRDFWEIQPKKNTKKQKVISKNYQRMCQISFLKMILDDFSIKASC